MANYLIKENIEISDVDKAIESLKYNLEFSNIKIEDIAEFIKTQKATIFYLDEKMNGISENDTSKAKYVWLDTGLLRGKEPLFFSLLNECGYFSGFYAGTPRYLANNIEKYYPRNTRDIENNLLKFKTKYERKIEDRLVKNIMAKYTGEEQDSGMLKKMTDSGINYESLPKGNTKNKQDVYSIKEEIRQKINDEYMKPSEVTEAVKQQLMINNWESDGGLDRYIKVIGNRLLQLIERKEEDYYILNNIKSAVVNTGLLNKFGVDIFLVYRFHVASNNYEPYKIVEGKSDIVEENFTKEQASKKIKPINFFDANNKEFDAEWEDFDINYSSLSHVIEERRGRFPEEIREVSANTIASKITQALEIGVKMAQRDRTYVKPTYSTKTGVVSWNMPLHIFKEFTENPELVMVVRKSGVFWEIKTILPYDEELRNKMTDLSLYHQMW